MTSYGDPQSYGRAHVPGADPDEYAYDSYADSYGADPYASEPDNYGFDSYQTGHSAASSGRAPTGGRASVSGGRASVGSAAVGSAAVGSASTGAAASARASVPSSAGRASVGRASVGQGSGAGSDHPGGHRYDWGAAGSQRPAGRASAPVSPASGRASVRPTSPGGPSGGGPGGGGPGGGGPGGPGGTGPGGSGGRGRRKKKKRHWIRNSLLSMLAVLIITTGGGMVALSYYVESVPSPDHVELPQASTVYYSDGKTEMATLAEYNREIIDTTIDELKNVRDAVVAAEDKKYWDHSGVDFAGIMRAAINNFTGGERQGASTITQQYVGAAAGIRDDASYTRKLKEAAMAYKLDSQEDKYVILDYYLNTVYFGRGAYGVQAAADAYFGKDAADLTIEEAAVIAGLIKTPDAGEGLSPFDPHYNPDDPSEAHDRWNYVMDQLVDMGNLAPEDRAAAEYPEVKEPRKAKEWHKGPQGNIVRQVRRELEAMGIEDIDTGGYRIITTIDKDIQKVARQTARRKGNDASYWEGPEKGIVASLVAVDPATGGVLAYYGGEDGTGVDLAGKNYNAEEDRWEGGRAPGSTFKIYTLIAAMREGVSFDSHWKTSDYQPPGYSVTIRNAGRRAENTGCEGVPPDYCTLRWSTQLSFNVPFFHYVEQSERQGGTGAAGVVKAARDAGITMMVDNNGNPHDLTGITDGTELARDPFDYFVSFGQYPITVLDHANGVATLAAGGLYHKAHFVDQVEVRNPETHEWETIRSAKIEGEQRVEKPIADAITGVLATIPARSNHHLANNRPAASKTGTWEHPDGGNRDAWVVGYTPQIATAVWVGDPDAGKIKYTWGEDIGSGNLPSYIWKDFMDKAHDVKEWPHQPFPPAPQIGNRQHSYANGEMPEPDPDPEDEEECRGPFPCNRDDDGDRTPGGPPPADQQQTAPEGGPADG